MAGSVSIMGALRAIAEVVRPPPDPRAIQAIQDRRLERQLHLALRVPFYRERIGSLLESTAGRPARERLAELPIQDRGTLADVPDSERIPDDVDPRKVIRLRTGGSTGHPLAILRTQDDWLQIKLSSFRQSLERGVRPWHRIFIAAQIMETAERSPTRWLHPGPRLARIRRASCLLSPEELLDQAQAWDPQVLRGYTGTLALMGQTRARDPGRWPRVRPRIVLGGAETMTPVRRQQLQAGFPEATIINFYGCFEFGPVAYECPATGLLHIAANTLLLEVLRPDGTPAQDGEEGQVVGTSLVNQVFPFLRYRMGDWVVRGPDRCPCGAPWPTLRSVVGRDMERFEFPDGSTYHPFRLAEAVFRSTGDFLQYQIGQPRPDAVILRVVPAPDADPARLRRELHHHLAAVVPAGVEASVETVDKIPFRPSGKFDIFWTWKSGAHATAPRPPGSAIPPTPTPGNPPC